MSLTSSSTSRSSNPSFMISQPIDHKEAYLSEDESGFNDSESEDDLSPILSAMITIPIPQNETEAKELMSQALAKRKSALHKSQLANAALRLCRSRAQHAKQVSDAADTYTAHVRRTIRQSNFSPKYRFTTVREPGVLGVKVTHIVDIPGGGSLVINLD